MIIMLPCSPIFERVLMPSPTPGGESGRRICPLFPPGRRRSPENEESQVSSSFPGSFGLVVVYGLTPVPPFRPPTASPRYRSSRPGSRLSRPAPVRVLAPAFVRRYARPLLPPLSASGVVDSSPLGGYVPPRWAGNIPPTRSFPSLQMHPKV